jgi:hypothetical protein
MTLAEHKSLVRAFWRITAVLVSLLLLPPFIALAVAPMLLFLVPVAIVGIPFMIPAFFSGSLSTSLELKRVESWRPRAFAAQHS